MIVWKIFFVVYSIITYTTQWVWHSVTQSRCYWQLYKCTDHHWFLLPWKWCMKTPLLQRLQHHWKATRFVEQDCHRLCKQKQRSSWVQLIDSVELEGWMEDLEGGKEKGGGGVGWREREGSWNNQFDVQIWQYLVIIGYLHWTSRYISTSTLPALLLAVQVYSPLSLRATDENNSVPWLDVTTPSLDDQVTKGVGSPVAAQVRMCCAPSTAVLLVGGWVNLGGTEHVCVCVGVAC